MPGQSLNVGLVGYQFMGKAHSNAWLQAPHYFDLPVQPVMHTLCGRSLEPLKKTAKSWGWKNHTQDYKEMLRNPEVDLIDVAVPNNAHRRS
jgi:predicted dehydrogenase